MPAVAAPAFSMSPTRAVLRGREGLLGPAGPGKRRERPALRLGRSRLGRWRRSVAPGPAVALDLFALPGEREERGAQDEPRGEHQDQPRKPAAPSGSSPTVTKSKAPLTMRRR